MSQPKWLDKYLVMKPEVNKIFDDLDATDKTTQEGRDQGIRLGLLFLVFRADKGCDAIAMHHLFHLHRRDEVALAIIGFQKAETTV